MFFRKHLGRLKSLSRVSPVRSRRDIPLHRDEADRPFFIVGSGRCGTTLLRRMLTAGDQVFIPPETQALQDIARLYERNRGLTWPELVAATIGTFASQSQFSEYFPGMSWSDLAGKLLAIPEDERSLARMLHECYNAFSDLFGSTAIRWGDKTPMYVYHLNWIDPIFPQARYVHLIRDGIDVVASRMNQLNDSSVEYAANRWSTAIDTFSKFQRRYNTRCIEIHYEELVDDPQAVLKQVCDFLSIKFSSSMVASTDHVKNMGDASIESHHDAVASALTRQSVGKGRRSLSSEQLQLCQDLIGEKLLQLGYPSAT